MEPFAAVVLGMHVAAGSAALVAAPVALVARKGAGVHRVAGRVFCAAMAVVLASALAAQLIVTDLFLLAVTVLSFYFCYTGYRYVGFLGPPPDRVRRPADVGAATLTLAACAAFVAFGLAGTAGFEPGRGSAVFAITGGGSALGPVALILGSLGGAFAIVDLVAGSRPASSPNGWLFAHIGRMLGAWIATLSAFSVVNLRMLPPIVRWLWPTAIGTPLITLFITVYSRRLYGRRALVGTSGLEIR